MTHHNIAGSEAFRSGPHVQIRMGRRRRPLHPALKLHLAMIPLGLGCGVVDVVSGQPVTILIAVAGLVAWRLWPAGR